MAKKPAASAKKKAPAKPKTKPAKPASKAKAKAGAYKEIKVIRRGAACVIQFNRPDKLNAFGPDMALEIIDALIKAEADRKVTAVVLAGDERAFCAGADLSAMPTDPSLRFDQYRERFAVTPGRQLYRTLCFYTKPVISAPEGYCLGGGFELALWGDFIVAGEGASFALPEVARGLIPGGGGTQNLPRLIGPALAKEMIWTGRRITAEEALGLRIVNHVVPEGQALDKALEIVEAMARNGPLGLLMSKQAINRGMDQSRFNGFLGEGDLFHMLYFSEDRTEGLKAFAERRPAKFKGQ
jgi:enoyl-CoA hydratase/carnithine racemase